MPIPSPDAQPGLLRVRPVEADDEQFMQQMLSEALRFENGNTVPWQGIMQYERGKRFLDNWGRDGDIGFVCVKKDNTTLGAAWIRDYPDYDPEWGNEDDLQGITKAELVIAVSKLYRGRGVGRMLTKGLLTSAKGEGLTSVSLSVNNSNVPARSLYESLGFSHRIEFAWGAIMAIDL